ncbi:MAG: peptidyl-prolyl cis-trans isomerase [candidate division KSB1 bacterium]|nr:peptidyl-prolyl cis-trans isomerase [candidate division KSB1 bacterium]
MARLHSQDKTSSGKGGWLGFLKWHDKGYGASFYEALHKLKKGQLSNVIRSSRGLHIVKLKTIREREQIPFEEKLDYLRRDYYTNHPEKVNEAYYGFIDKLKKNYNYSLYENTVDSLVHWFDKTSYDYRTNQGFNEFINSLTNRQMNMPVYSFSEQTVIVFDFLNRVMKNLPQGARPELGMKEPWDRILFLDPTKQLCLKYGYDHDFDSRNPVAKKVRRFLEDEMYKIQKSRNIDNRVNPTEDECRQYFTENAQRFEKDPKVKVQEIYVKGKELADWLYHRIQNGESFAKLAEQYTERDSVVNRQGVLGFISPVRHRGITHKAFRMLPGEVSEPIYYSGHYSVIKVLERQPGEPRTYEQAEDIVKAALKRKKTDDLHENWLKELRSESQITTFPDVLAAEFAGENE